MPKVKVKWTDSDLQTLFQMRRTYSVAEIAEHFKVSKPRIYQILNKYRKEDPHGIPDNVVSLIRKQI